MNIRIKAKLLGLAIAATLAGSALAQVNAKFAVTLPEKSHQGQGVAKFVELVDKKSQGRIKIKPFYNGALGNDVQVTSSLQGGTIELVEGNQRTLLTCAPGNGWQLTGPSTVEIMGTACMALQNATNASLDASFPCDTIIFE